MPRISLLLILLLVHLASPSRSAAQHRDSRWSIALSASLAGFRGAALDTSTTERLSIRPGQGIALGITGTRRWGPWSLSLGMSHLPTHVEAISHEIAVQERTQQLERIRLALTVARRIADVGAGALELRASPALDHWSVEGHDGRTVGGGEMALALQLPASVAMIENVIGVSWSPGPFHRDELPTGYRRQRLRTITMGVGIRFGR